MEYTEDQKEQFKQQFAAKRRRQILLIFPLVGFALFAAFTDKDHGISVLGIPPADLMFAVAIVALGAVAFSFWNWRCPACSRYLGRGLGPRFCPRCGVELR